MFKFNVHAKEWSGPMVSEEEISSLASKPLLPTPPTPAPAPKVYSEPRHNMVMAPPYPPPQTYHQPYVSHHWAYGHPPPPPQPVHHHNPWATVEHRPSMWGPPPPVAPPLPLPPLTPVLTKKVSEVCEDPENSVTNIINEVLEPVKESVKEPEKGPDPPKPVPVMEPVVEANVKIPVMEPEAAVEPEKPKKKTKAKKKEVVSPPIPPVKKQVPPPAEDIPQFPVPDYYTLDERDLWIKLCPPSNLARDPKFHNMSCIGEPRQMWLVRQIMKTYKFRLIKTNKENHVYMIQPLKLSKSDLDGMNFRVYFYKFKQIPFMIETDDSEFEEKVTYDQKKPTCIRKRSFYDYTYGKRVINETFDHHKKTKYIEILSLPSFEKIETRTITGDNYIEDLY